MGCFVLDDVKLLGQVKRQRNIYVHELAEQTFQVTTEHEVALLHDAADLYRRFDTWWFKNMSMRFAPHWNDLAAETCGDRDAWDEREIRNHDACLERATASTTSMARLEELITLVLEDPMVRELLPYWFDEEEVPDQGSAPSHDMRSLEFTTITKIG